MLLTGCSDSITPSHVSTMPATVTNIVSCYLKKFVTWKQVYLLRIETQLQFIAIIIIDISGIRSLLVEDTF